MVASRSRKASIPVKVGAFNVLSNGLVAIISNRLILSRSRENLLLGKSFVYIYT